MALALHRAVVQPLSYLLVAVAEVVTPMGTMAEAAVEVERLTVLLAWVEEPPLDTRQAKVLVVALPYKVRLKVMLWEAVVEKGARQHLMTLGIVPNLVAAEVRGRAQIVL